jgi:predicted nucleic-acid-binding protein
MKATVDTNVLVRAVVEDDRKQAAAAGRLLREAETIAVSLTCLCEFVWVLDRVYGLGREEIASAIRALLDTEKVVAHRDGAEAGLAMLRAGGDFADGVIAWEGRWLGGETFVSFDRKAVALLQKRRQAAKWLRSS